MSTCTRTTNITGTTTIPRGMDTSRTRIHTCTHRSSTHMRTIRICIIGTDIERRSGILASAR